MRLFVAVEMPVFQKISEIYKAIEMSGADVKLVEPENLHITLVFIGEVPDFKLNSVKEAVSSVTFKPFKVKLKGMGAFPSMTKPRVVWIGIEEGFTELRNIRDTLMKELKSRGIRPEDEKEFVPHLTLGRVKGPRNLFNLINIINENSNVEIGEINVDSIKLFKSTLTPKGPIYEVLHEVKGVAGN